MNWNHESLVRMNLENLSAFWTSCGLGSALDSKVAYSAHWPHRAWLLPTAELSQDNSVKLISAAQSIGPRGLVPVWPIHASVLEDHLRHDDMEVRLTQELMAQRLDRLKVARSTLEIRDVVSLDDARGWASVGSAGFGYTIDENVIIGLLDDPNAFLYLSFNEDGFAVGTGLLYQTGDVAGFHMVAVPPVYRRRGYARQIMLALIHKAHTLDCRLATLQASTAGAPLYLQLGFESQGSFHSFGSPSA